MQKVVIDQPYQFIPPLVTNFWPSLIQLYLPRFLRKMYGVHSVECRRVELLKRSVDAGHGILLAPNHCRLSDPLVLGRLARAVGVHLYAMASWHLFKQDWFTTFMIRRMGAFSVYREGMDRQALNAAIDILVDARRPLIVFPEGAISRHNDQLMGLLDGVAFMARTAARRRAKKSPPGRVVVHPVAIRYYFRGDLQTSLDPALMEIENHFSWKSQQDKSLIQRIRQVGEALLALKEIEAFGHAQQGDLYERVEALIDQLLCPLEKEWKITQRESNTVARVKRLREAIVPDLINGDVSETERARRWRQLSDCYYAQQMSHYPRNYISRSGKNLPERILETVERFEEDLTDKARIYEPLHTVIQVGEAIDVGPDRDRKSEIDPVMREIENQLTTMLAELAAESQASE